MSQPLPPELASLLAGVILLCAPLLWRVLR